MAELAPMPDAFRALGIQTATDPVVKITAASSQVISNLTNGKILDCDVVTQQMPSGLGAYSAILLPPASGVVTLQPVSGSTVTLNGATTPITRSRASNPAGFCIIPTFIDDAFLVSGS